MNDILKVINEFKKNNKDIDVSYKLKKDTIELYISKDRVEIFDSINTKNYNINDIKNNFIYYKELIEFELEKINEWNSKFINNL